MVLNLTSAFKRMLLYKPDAALIVSNGLLARALYDIADRSRNFYMLGSMGAAPAIAQGLALARRDLTVIVIEGDGNAMMGLANFITIGRSELVNLHHVIFDNGLHASTGGQRTFSDTVSFPQIAQACGYRRTTTNWSEVSEIIKSEGPSCSSLHVDYSSSDHFPRVSLTPEEIRSRFQSSLRI